MAEGEVSALKEALCNQYIIMKKLYAELEEERDASATAASEALSMILRLQREKAAEKMEACQYKRMAEERIYHADESLEILEEILQQRDMEIRSLQYQLRTFKEKLSSLGIIITPDSGEMKLAGEESYIEANVGSSKESSSGAFRRHVSLPSLGSDKFCFHIGFHGDEYPTSPSGRSNWRRTGEFATQLFQNNEKEISNLASNEVHGTSPICSIGSWFSAVSDTSSDSTEVGKGMKSDDEFTSGSSSTFDHNENAQNMEREPCIVHDIFEVPESHKGCNLGEPCKNVLQNSIFETNNMMESPEFRPKEAVDYLYENEECLSKAFMGNHNGNKFCMPNKSSTHHCCKFSTMKVNAVGCPLALMESKAELEQLRRRLQQLEDERVRMQEDTERGKEQLKLLREMFKQLNSIETHLKSSTSRKSSHMDESSLATIIEAVLSFSI